MKKLLLGGLFLFTMVAFTFGQTIVGTEPENKNVVLEEFTGLNCGYCPQGHQIAQDLQDANPGDVMLVNVHVGSFATPSGNQPDFRTPWGSALDAQANVAGYPAGTVNRHMFSGWGQSGGTAMSRNYWTQAANQILAQPSYLNVGAEATIITSTRQLVVNVEVYYTGDNPVSSNFLTVALMQNNIINYQTDYTLPSPYADYNYHHMHMLRQFLTGQWGEEITETSEGSLYTTTLYYEIPEDYNDIECVLEDLEVAAYVAESHQEIISGCYAPITYIDALELDASITDFNIPQTNCGDEMSGSATIKNFGTSELTSLDFEYSVNDGELQSYSWNGNLAQNETETVELPTFAIDADQTNTFYFNSMNPNGSEDELPQNNGFSTEFEKSTYLPQNCKVAILTDNHPEETTWDIKNSAGEIIASGGPYSSSSIYLEPFVWPANDCYTFTIYDAGGDGLDGGFYKIAKANTQIIWEGNNDFQYEASAEFSYDELMNVENTPLKEEFSIYPNPVADMAQIEFTLLKESTVQLGVYDLLGKRIIQIYDGTAPFGQQNFSFNTQNLDQGIYFAKLNINGQEQVKKIQVSK